MVDLAEQGKAVVRRHGQVGERVMLILDGRVGCDLDTRGCRALIGALTRAVKAAEEAEQAERIALDQATLLRAGFPVGLTSHPVIQHEAAKLAAHDRDLRRSLPGGIRSQEQFGAPTIVRYDP